MKIPIFILSVVAVVVVTASNVRTDNAARVVDLKSTDGTVLKATYFAARCVVISSKQSHA